MLPNVVVGGGIVGLAVAKALQELDPDRRTVLVEKEHQVAHHQTGHNSGVIHSGLYYTPGSLKARLVRKGSSDLLAYCTEHGIPCDVPASTRWPRGSPASGCLVPSWWSPPAGSTIARSRLPSRKRCSHAAGRSDTTNLCCR